MSAWFFKFKKAQESIDNSTKILNENAELILNTRQEIKDLKDKLNEALSNYHSLEINSKQYEVETSAELEDLRKQVNFVIYRIPN